MKFGDTWGSTPGLEMVRYTVVTSAGARARIEKMAAMEGHTRDEILEGLMREGDITTARAGLGELMELKRVGR